ncbi:MAG: S-formylglutathione hydrolase [Gammaproteobacteria bacterium]
MERISRHKVCGGWLERYRHAASTCQCDMCFSIYLPPQAEKQKLPVLYWLSGLTCTDENFFQKAGAERYAAEAGIILVACDTSPRKVHLPGDETDWDLGTGAGFYLNATKAPWSRHYRLYDYVLDELPRLVASHFPVDAQRKSIFGHSMGGHGALVLALRNSGVYRSISAFAPIVAPMQCAWGNKAFSNYLGEDKSLWQDYDASCLVQKAQHKLPILIDQGEADEFLVEQLKPEILQLACTQADHPLTLRMQAGYDHSYFFIRSFVGEHIAYHAEALAR